MDPHSNFIASETPAEVEIVGFCSAVGVFTAFEEDITALVLFDGSFPEFPRFLGNVGHLIQPRQEFILGNEGQRALVLPLHKDGVPVLMRIRATMGAAERFALYRRRNVLAAWAGLLFSG